MIKEKNVENIKKYGVFKDTGESRLKVLKEDMGFKLDQKADYVLIGGCVQPEILTSVFKSLKNVLDRLQIDYTMLSKEFCCGWMPIGQPAVMSRNEGDIARYREISKDFILENFKQAEALGAKSIVLFCAACEPSYSNYKDATNLEIIPYTELLDRHFDGGKLDLEIDYYAGCFRFRRRITEEPLDIEPTKRLLEKIEGLKVNYLNNDLCCFKAPQLKELTNSLTTNNLITICTGCYQNLKGKLGRKKDCQVRMLPELLLDVTL